MQHFPILSRSGLVFALVVAVAVVTACTGAPTQAPVATAAPQVPAPTAVATAAPTAVPPTVAPTAVPPTAVPPTKEPPTAAPTATPVPPSPTDTPESLAEPTEEATPEIPIELPNPTAAATSLANPLGLPVAKDAVDLTFDETDVNYDSPSDVKTLVEFYRSKLTADGWGENKDTATTNDAFAVLEFSKGDAHVSLMIMNSGSNCHVTITTSGLEAAQVEEGTPTTAGGELAAVDKDGLPVPSDYTEYVGDSGPYRQGLTATSPSSVLAVAALYRKELAARSWSEIPGTVGPTADGATLMFQNPDKGQLELKLTKNASGGTDVVLTIRSEAAAKADGILPPEGMARLYFGNTTDVALTVKLDGQEIKVPVEAGGAGSSPATTPHLDVKPGKHTFTASLPKQNNAKLDISVAAGDVWAIAAGDDGALPIQIY